MEAIKNMTFATRSGWYDAVKLVQEDGIFFVPTKLNGQWLVPMVFDTGKEGTVISAQLAYKIGVVPEPEGARVPVRMADGTTFEATRGSIRSMNIGATWLRNIECLVFPEERGDFDPLLGQSVFKRFQVKFHPPSGTLHLFRMPADGVDQRLEPDVFRQN
jgi:clan AA aspartic protease (TIGR02281 family)